MNQLRVQIKPPRLYYTAWYYGNYGGKDLTGEILNVWEYSYDRYTVDGKFIFKTDCVIINKYKNDTNKAECRNNPPG